MKAPPSTPSWLDQATDRFLAAEASDMAATGVEPGSIVVAGIGTTAAKALGGTLLARALGQAGWHVERTAAHVGPSELMADKTWQLAIVLSPWKLAVADHCVALSPSAVATEVVDTVVRTPKGPIGLNTNTWAAQSAMEVLMGDKAPTSVLLIGSGASARSVSLAVRRAWPDTDLGVAARSAAGAVAIAERFGAQPVDVAQSPPSDGRCLVVNATTWGETEESEQHDLAIDLSKSWGPGVMLFDLNNRVGTLPVQALSAGSVVVSGALMQKTTNAARAALVAYTASADR